MKITNNQTVNALDVFNYLIKNQIITNSADFIKKIEIPHSTWNGIFNNKRDISVAVILKICTTFGVNPTYIFNKTGPLLLKNGKINEQLDPEVIKIRSIEPFSTQETPTSRMLHVTNLLKNEGKFKNWTQLAHILNISLPLWTNINKGKSSAMIWLISAFSETFSVSIDYLILGKHPIFVKNLDIYRHLEKQTDPKYMATNLATNLATNHENTPILGHVVNEPEAVYNKKQTVPKNEQENTIKVVIHISKAILEANKPIVIHIVPEELNNG
jgi:transcriptional regulator with XRE-family HTH domain